MNTTLLPLTPASFSAALTDTATWAQPYFDALFPLGMWMLALSIAVIIASLVISTISGTLYWLVDKVETRFLRPESPADRYVIGTKVDYIKEQKNYAAFKRFENQQDADDIIERYK